MLCRLLLVAKLYTDSSSVWRCTLGNLITFTGLLGISIIALTLELTWVLPPLVVNWEKKGEILFQVFQSAAECIFNQCQASFHLALRQGFLLIILHQFYQKVASLSLHLFSSNNKRWDECINCITLWNRKTGFFSQKGSTQASCTCCGLNKQAAHVSPPHWIRKWISSK